MDPLTLRPPEPMLHWERRDVWYLDLDQPHQTRSLESPKIQPNPDEKTQWNKMHVACGKCGSLPQSFFTTLRKTTHKSWFNRQTSESTPNSSWYGRPSNGQRDKLSYTKLNNSAAGASGIRAEIYKALATNPETFSTIRRITHDFWTEEKQPEEFNYERLGILTKKGDLSVPGNYRGIMML